MRPIVLLLLAACRAPADPKPAEPGGEDGSTDDTDTPTDDSGGGGGTGADDTTPPSWAPSARVDGRVGEALTVALEATDPDGDPLTFRGNALPDGAAVDAETGVLTWTPAEAQVGLHPGVTLIADDGVETAEVAFDIAVSADSLTAVALPAITDERLAPDATLPAGADATLRFTAAPGEHEAGRLVLFADADWGAMALDIPDLEGPDGTLSADTLDVRTVKLWWQAGTDHRKTDARVLVPELLLKDDTLVRTTGTDNGVRAADGSWIDISTDGALSERLAVDPADFDVADAAAFVPVDVSAGQNKQLWLTLSVPDDQPPGVYTGEVQVTSGGSPVAWVPIEVEVLPFDLPDSPLTYSVYYRGELSADWPDGSVSSEFKSVGQLEVDLASMTAHGIVNPTVYQPPTDPLFEDVLEARQNARMGGQPIYLVRGNAIYLGRSDAQFRQEVRDAITTSQAWGATDVYFMGRDEGRDEQLLAQRPAWAAVREEGGKVWTAGYRTTAWRGPGNFELVGDLQDLLICAFRPSAEEAALWHGIGSEIFVYENPQGGLEYPELNRRNFGLLLWQEDYDGAMTYAWQDSFGHGWNDFDHVEMRDFNFAYPTTDGVIDTIQYEGFREAVDDTRYLAALEAAIDATAADTADVDAWLAELKRAPLARMDLHDVRDRMVGWTLHLSAAEVSTTPAAGVSDVVVHPVNRDGELVVEWRTARRSTSLVRFGEGAEPDQETAEEPALVHHHRVAIPAVDASAEMVVQVVSRDGAGGEMTSDLLDAGTGVALAVGVQAPTPADGDTISGDLEVAATPTSTHAVSAFADVDGSLLAWWRFGEADGEPAEDASGWGRTATMSGGAGTRTDGWSGDGLWLSGDGQYAEAGDLGVPLNGTATVEGWYRFDELAVDHGAPLGLFAGAYIHPVNDHIYFRSTNDWFRSSSHLTPGAWHHIAIAWDGDTASAQLWIDGNALPINVQSGSQDIVALDAFTIGRSFGHMAGTIDELRVWDRVLSEAEVRALVDAHGTPLDVVFPLPPGESTLTVTAMDVDDQVVSETRTVIVQ